MDGLLSVHNNGCTSSSYDSDLLEEAVGAPPTGVLGGNSIDLGNTECLSISTTTTSCKRGVVHGWAGNLDIRDTISSFRFSVGVCGTCLNESSLGTDEEVEVSLGIAAETCILGNTTIDGGSSCWEMGCVGGSGSGSGLEDVVGGEIGVGSGAPDTGSSDALDASTTESKSYLCCNCFSSSGVVDLTGTVCGVGPSGDCCISCSCCGWSS